MTTTEKRERDGIMPGCGAPMEYADQRRECGH